MLAWLLTLHVLGLCLWTAGVFGAGRVLIDQARLGPQGAPLGPSARRLLLASAHPGMTLAMITGAAALAQNPGYYFHEGWMHAKLACAFLAAAATVVLTVLARKLQRPEGAPSARSVVVWRGVFMGALLASLVLVFVKPV
ncbi:MAG: CopD family protein [Elusimicrobia bacterium]|nr:CopD family protein [Elusimicrobiota bacterium]